MVSTLKYISYFYVIIEAGFSYESSSISPKKKKLRKSLFDGYEYHPAPKRNIEIKSSIYVNCRTLSNFRAIFRKTKLIHSAFLRRNTQKENCKIVTFVYIVMKLKVTAIRIICGESHLQKNYVNRWSIARLHKIIFFLRFLDNEIKINDKFYLLIYLFFCVLRLED